MEKYKVLRNGVVKKMKTTICGILIAMIMIFICSAMFASAHENSNIEVDFESTEYQMKQGTDFVLFDNHIFISSNQLLSFLPYEPLPGKAISWNSQMKMLTIFEETINPYHEINTDKKFRFSIVPGKDHFYIGENKVSLSHPAIISDSRLYVPLRGVLEGYGYSVDWDQDTKGVTLTR